MFATFVVFLFGLTVGSFLNVVIIRGGRGETLGGRSRCESCKAVLSPFELVPVISFAFLKGRCRHCGAALSWQYPLVELGTALLYVGAWQLWRPYFVFPSLDLFTLSAISALSLGLGASIVILVSDFRYRIIPNGAVLVLAVIGLAERILDRPSLPAALAAALIFSAVLALFWFFSKGTAMGLGDAKLIFATSLVLGYPLSLPGFLFAFWLGGIAGILLILSGRKTLKDQVPFGPFIIIGAALAQILGQRFLALSGLINFLW
ncbi:MAG: prepilin peptidase [Candidatus Sungbacteria bacterium]|nr:prepilin peptidase [Candidatus Sungbacteria bacterium]